MNNFKGSVIFETARILTRAHGRSLMLEAQQEHGLLETSLLRNSMSEFLLSEQEADAGTAPAAEGPKFSKEEARELAKAAEQIRAGLKATEDALNKAPNKFVSTIKALSDLSGEIPDTGIITGLAIMDDAKAMTAQTEEVNKTIAAASEAASTVIGTVEKFVTDLGPIIAKVNASEDASLEDLAKAHKESGFPDVAKLKQAAVKAIEVPGWFTQAWSGGMESAKAETGGFFKKAVSFVKGLFADKETGIDPDTFASELVKCTPNELKEVAEKLEAVKAAWVTAVESAASGTTQANVGAASLAPGGAEGTAPAGAPGAAPAEGDTEGLTPAETVEVEAEAESVADELGTGPISKKELTAILKSRSFSELGGEGGKATRHRRIFRKAINQAAGKEVFEERLSVMRKRANLPSLAEVLLPVSEPRSKLQRQGQRLGLQKPRDHELNADRWLELAGLGEE